jgi:hypothetical protein
LNIDPRDGIFTYRDPTSNDILLESIEDRKTQVFVQEKDLVSTIQILCKLITNKRSYSRKLKMEL